MSAQEHLYDIPPPHPADLDIDHVDSSIIYDRPEDHADLGSDTPPHLEQLDREREALRRRAERHAEWQACYAGAQASHIRPGAALAPWEVDAMTSLPEIDADPIDVLARIDEPGALEMLKRELAKAQAQRDDAMNALETAEQERDDAQAMAVSNFEAQQITRRRAEQDREEIDRMTGAMGRLERDNRRLRALFNSGCIVAKNVRAAEYRLDAEYWGRYAAEWIEFGDADGAGKAARQAFHFAGKSVALRLEVAR